MGLRNRLRASRDDERGAVAILVAVCATALFAASALAVDLGNAYQRKGEVQSQADLAALAAGASLPDRAAVLSAVCTSAGLNVKVGEELSSCVAGSSTTAAADPVCPADTGGKPYVYFFADNAYKAKVCSPPAHVGYGLAQAIPGAADGVDVRGSATVMAGSPGVSSELPFYGYQGCDWGPQTLTDPAHGQAQDTGLPANLAQPSPARFQNVNIAGMTPTQVDPPATGATVQVNGSGLSLVTQVGFYRETSFATNSVQATLPSQSDSTGKTISFDVPAAVLANPGVWYLRVYSTKGSGGWSTTTLVLRIGEALLECGAISDEGNFGALRLPRLDSASGAWMAQNIANGLQPPLSLAVGSGSGLCHDGGSGVVFSSVTGNPTLKSQTNCVATDPGLPANATTDGLLGTGGRLTKAPTTTGVVGGRSCGPYHSASSWSPPNGGAAANDDTLTCFLSDPSIPISTIASAGYAGPAVLDPAIFSSPRFCQVPIVSQKPDKGTSQDYWIVDVRPCFITGELATSSYNSQQFAPDPTAHNGLKFGPNHRISELHVVFFNRNALPNSGADIGAYLGTGPVAVQLVQ